MQPFPKQSYYLRSPALELLFYSLCGPPTKKFGDPVLECSEKLVSKVRPPKLKDFTQKSACYLEYRYSHETRKMYKEKTKRTRNIGQLSPA